MGFANSYLEKDTVYNPFISQAPNENLGLIVVIPCYNEPDIISNAIQSLFNCTSTTNPVEIIVVVNASKNDSVKIKAINEKTHKDLEEWSLNYNSSGIKLYTIYLSNLPRKQFGAGLARKIGMDEAVHRFNKINKPNGVIVSFDADCKCKNNYLLEIENNILFEKAVNTGIIYFEHPTEGSEFDEIIYSGIVNYELYLRYVIQGLRFANFPYAYHTVGSCFAVKSQVYVKQGGMNKKQGGEDFYFLHKVFPLGGVREINTTKVIPSPRPSDRVPFGTGPVINKMITNKNEEFLTYHPAAFEELKVLFNKIHEFYKQGPTTIDKLIKEIPVEIQNFLKQQDVFIKIDEINRNSASKESFVKRFFSWFNGFKVVKFLNYMNLIYEQTGISEASKKFLKIINIPLYSEEINAKKLLKFYRDLQKQ